MGILMLSVLGGSVSPLFWGKMSLKEMCAFNGGKCLSDHGD